MFDDDEDLAMERAYDRATLRHRKADAAEYRDTGGQLDPMPDFETWVTPPHEDDDDDA